MATDFELSIRQGLKLIDWISQNKEWFFSGLGIFLIGGSWGVVKFFFSRKDHSPAGVIINNMQTINHNDNSALLPHEAKKDSVRTLESYKNETHILFIDDDLKFKVAKILAKSGWVHTKLIKDAITLDEPDILKADILFIDVQGVGIALGFSDEGLGLALAVKEKYPEKKVVIYSAETKGDRFHQALRKADSFLSKNADPYEFQKIVEDFTVGSKA